MSRIKKWLFLVVLLLLAMLAKDLCGQAEADLLAKIDRYRMLAGSFRMDVRLQDYDGETLKDEALFKGFFAGDDRSLLICDSGKDKGMKVLMKGDDMWVNLGGSKRALRITPMQRLMGEASNGDVAKVSFNRDYTGKRLDDEGGLLKLELKAKSTGATYQRVLLYADPRTHQPVKAEFFLLSGKHYKTAHYQKGTVGDNRAAITTMRIEDKRNPRRYTLMEYLDFKPGQFPEKYFNVMYLPQIEAE
ncbi:MAG: outer membrane lipoprotein-sorting protein [Candidatus Aminicenantes bacterium]|nr:outer membrane lipoprotein-sorting protein [Candidatus Aminicenantes bacterium]